MAKKSAVERNDKRRRLVKKYAARRAALLVKARDREQPIEERFQARLKLAKLPRNSSHVRVRNRCGITGRPRGHNRKFNMSRVSLRELASQGLIPGVVKASW